MTNELNSTILENQRDNNSSFKVPTNTKIKGDSKPRGTITQTSCEGAYLGTPCAHGELPVDSDRFIKL